MKGSIRLLVGFLITFGAVGTLEVNPDASLLAQSALAVIGLLIAFDGTCAIKQSIGEA